LPKTVRLAASANPGLDCIVLKKPAPFFNTGTFSALLRVAFV
jgi:hypothetical protein